MPQASPQSPQQFVQRLKIIFYAQVVMLIGLTVALYLNKPDVVVESGFTDTLLYVLAFLAVTMIAASSFIFKIIVTRAQQESVLTGKLTKYMAATLVRMACFELIGLFAGVIVFLTGKSLALVGTALALMLFAAFQPSRERIVEELNLSPEEASQIS